MGLRRWLLFRALGALRIGSQNAYVFLIYARNLRPRVPAYHLEIEATFAVPTVSEPSKEKRYFLLMLSKKGTASILR